MVAFPIDMNYFNIHELLLAALLLAAWWASISSSLDMITQGPKDITKKSRWTAMKDYLWVLEGVTVIGLLYLIMNIYNRRNEMSKFMNTPVHYMYMVLGIIWVATFGSTLYFWNEAGEETQKKFPAVKDMSIGYIVVGAILIVMSMGILGHQAYKSLPRASIPTSSAQPASVFTGRKFFD
jgi:SNF family Na+-dependent transporter